MTTQEEEDEFGWMRRHYERYDRRMKAMLEAAKGKPRCLSVCAGARCEKAMSDHDKHVTTEGGGYGFWATFQQDKDLSRPTIWDRLLGAGV